MTAFLQTTLGKILMTMGVSALPIVELRLGLPYGVALGLDPWTAFFAAVIGNLIPVPFIILLIRRIFDWLRDTRRLGPTIHRLEDKAHLKGRLVRKYRLPGLVVLVAIPLPGTGAWTGALVAALLNIRLRHAFPAILAGVAIAGMIMLSLTYGVIHLFN